MGTTPTGTSAPERRRKTRNQRIPPVAVRLKPHGAPESDWNPVVLVDAGEGGLGVQGREPVEVGTDLDIQASPEMAAHVGKTRPHGRVAWCRRTNSGLYRYGIAFIDEPAKKTAWSEPPRKESGRPEQARQHRESEKEPETKHGEHRGPSDPGDPQADTDYYELLQVHPKATPEMIHRAYRMLAQVYHPDNKETGTEDGFRALTLAYRLLSDPEKRASYDLERNRAVQSIWSVFHGSAPRTGLAMERRKRHGILAALYQKRAAEPHAPALSVFELEDVLSVSRDQIEFTLWYLRERGLVMRSDNNRYILTVDGVDALDKLEDSAPEDGRYFRGPDLKQLTAGS